MPSTLKRQTFSGVLWSALERFSVQGIQFILSFVIARQLLPSDYGLIAMFSIFMAIAQRFVDSGFSNALIQKQNRTDRDYSTVFHFNIAIGIIMYLLLIILSPAIASFYKQPILEDIIIWVGLNLIINSFATIQRTILTIQLNFKRQALISLIAVILSGSIAVYMALNGYGVWTLVVQGLLNSIINTLLLWITSKWHPKLLFSVSSFKELFSFGSKILMSGLLHTIYTNIYTLIIGKIFPVKELGLYSKASSLSQYPSTNISGILDRALYPVLCRFQNEDQVLTEKFYIFIRLTAFCIFPLMIGLAVLSKPFVLLVLTEKWIEAVPYLQILCIAYMWDPIMRMSWNLLNVKHRSDYSLKSEIIKKITAMIYLLLSIPFGIKAMCWGLVLYALSDIFIILQFTNKILPEINILNHLKNLYLPFLQSILMGIGVDLFIHFLVNPWFQLLGGIIIGIIIYLLLSIIMCKKEFKYVFQLIKK